MKRWLTTFALGLAAIYLFNPAGADGWAPLARLFGLASYRVPYAWMEPALEPGDHVLVRLDAYRDRAPMRGQIIVFPYPYDPTRTYLGRVIGIGGDSVAIEDGAVLVNGEAIPESYRRFVPQAPYSLVMAPMTVPAGQLFVLGDNRDWSKDSRIWGPLPARNVLGEVYYVWLATDMARIGTIK